MVPYKKILITTDGTQKSYPAVSFGMNMAKLMGAEVSALSVIDDGDYEDMMGAAIPEAESILYQQSVEAVESISAQGRKKGVPVKPIVIGGIPSSIIVEAPKDHDLTVMGTVGRTGASHILIGSVAEKVVRTANSPVWVVHASDKVMSDGLNVKKVLIPTDGSENTRPAIAHGLALAEAFDAEVTVLSVAGRSSENQIEASRKSADSIAAEGKGMGLTTFSLTLTGIPVDRIVKAIGNFDLIVMGTVGRTGLAHIRIGSVAEGTVRQARCPVLVVSAKG